MQAGRTEKWEFDYKRHGTLCLLANWLVAEGRIIAPTVSPTHREADDANHIQQTIASAPDGGWIFIHHQLNTHYSESLVGLAVTHCQ